MKTKIITLIALLIAGGLNMYAQDKKILVAYFSWSGNTQYVAEQIAKQTGGTLFRIEPVKPYPTEYTPCTEVAKQGGRLGQLRHGVHRLPRMVVDRPDDHQHLYREL